MSMVEQLLQELGVESVENVKEVLPRRALANRVLIGEVPHQEVVIGELRPQRLHRELLIMWDFYVRDVALLDQRLLVGEDLLEEVLVDQGLRRQVELEATLRQNGYGIGRRL